MARRPVLVVISWVFVAAFVVVLVPAVPQGWRHAAAGVVEAVWAVFAADFVARLVRSGDRREFLRGHSAEAFVFTAPFVTLVTGTPVRSALWPARIATRVTRRAGRSAGLAAYLVVLIVSMVLVCALVVWLVERDARGGNITSFGIAVWWACVTVTSVGYGDYVPVTLPGRVAAVFLMLNGIGLLGLLVAGVASTFVRRGAERVVGRDDGTGDLVGGRAGPGVAPSDGARIEALTARVVDLQEAVEDLRRELRAARRPE